MSSRMKCPRANQRKIPDEKNRTAFINEKANVVQVYILCTLLQEIGERC